MDWIKKISVRVILCVCESFRIAEKGGLLKGKPDIPIYFRIQYLNQREIDPTYRTLKLGEEN